MDRTKYNAQVAVQSAAVRYPDGTVRAVIGTAAKRQQFGIDGRQDPLNLLDFLKLDLQRRQSSLSDVVSDEALKRADDEGSVTIEYRLEAGLNNPLERVMDLDRSEREVAAIDVSYLITVRRRADS